MVKAVHHPAILHLATHGFFLPDAAREDQAEQPQARGGLDHLAGGDDIRSGSRLGGTVGALWQQSGGGSHAAIGGGTCGANDTLAGRAPSGGDDGILTAEEVIQLDLWGTSLVTISACESGLGDVQVSEGVFGLRRAFTLAVTLPRRVALVGGRSGNPAADDGHV